MDILHPNDDEDRLTFLRMSCDAFIHDSQQKRLYLRSETTSLLAELFGAFINAHQEFNDATDRYQKYESMSQKTAAQLRSKLQWLWTNSQLASVSGQPDGAGAIRDALASRGSIPMPKSRIQWVKLGTKVLQCDLAARDSGSPRLSNRYALELSINAASKAQNELRTAFAQRERARNQIQKTRRGINDLYCRIAADLSDSLSVLPPEIQRLFMRSYGVVFAEDVKENMTNDVAENMAVDLSAPPDKFAPPEAWISYLTSVYA